MPPSSPKPAGALRPGLYERLITRALKAELETLIADGTTVAQTKAVDPAEADSTLARHIEAIVARALRGLPSKDRETRQAEIANGIVEFLAANADLNTAIAPEDAVALPPEELLAVQRVTGDPADDREPHGPKGGSPPPISSSTPAVNRRWATPWRTRSPPPTPSTCSAPSSAGTASAC